MTEQHADPIAEGLTHGGQRIVQFVAVAAVGKQAQARHRFRIEQARQRKDWAAARQAEQLHKAVFEQARSRWAPAHDPRWLDRADLIQVARAWSAALPYVATHTAAASAVRKCEERLRQLHPHGMSHYDRFRSAGLAPEEAMREAAPFFARNPNVRTGHPATRRELTEGTGTRQTPAEQPTDTRLSNDTRQVQQALRLIDEIQTQHLAHGLEDLHPEDLRTALENATNLPGHTITQAIHQHPATRPATEGVQPDGLPSTGPAHDIASPSAHAPTPPNRQTTSRTPSTGTDPSARTPAQIAGDDFPYTISEAIYLAIRQPTEPQPGRPHSPNWTRRHRPSR
jgi:hypothetical protein